MKTQLLTLTRLLTGLTCAALSAAPASAQMPSTTTSSSPTSTGASAPSRGAQPRDVFLAQPGTYAPFQTAQPTDVFLARPGTYAPRYGRPGDLPPRPFGFGFTEAFIPSGVMFVGLALPPENPATGELLLRVTPGHAQVFVDGAYVGFASDFARGGYRIDAGPHRIELRADGYETHAFDKRILANDAVIYRQDLWEVRRPAAAAAPQFDTMAVRRPYYVIPGCYGGNTPPVVSRLPAGCDVTALRTREYMVRVPSS